MFKNFALHFSRRHDNRHAISARPAVRLASSTLAPRSTTAVIKARQSAAVAACLSSRPGRAAW